MDNGYDTGFRVSNLSWSTILVGTLILVGLPLGVFAIILLAGEGFEFAFYTSVILLYYFIIGAYAYARWGEARFHHGQQTKTTMNSAYLI
jgi:hypothetical protein